MKVLLLLFVLLSFTCFAQEDDETIFESLTNAIIGTECERFLKESERNTSIAIQAAQQEKWDPAFYYDEQAFFSILKAISYCENEPENLVKAEHYLDEHKDIYKRLTCSFHSLEARDSIARAKTAFNEKDYKEALNQASWGMYYLGEGVEWCEYDPARVEQLLIVTGQGYLLLEIIQEYIDNGY